MTALQLQAEITNLLKDESDLSVLEAIRLLLKRNKDTAMDDDLTDEELAELDRRRAEYESGKGVSFTVEESLARLRDRKP